jgi:PPP family 3-phenylpropionic acid transporter
LGNWFFSLAGGMVLDAYDIFATYLLFGGMTLVGVGILVLLNRMEGSSSATASEGKKVTSKR